MGGKSVTGGRVVGSQKSCVDRHRSRFGQSRMAVSKHRTTRLSSQLEALACRGELLPAAGKLRPSLLAKQFASGSLRNSALFQSFQ
jgi:hypothetical protein